MKRTGKCTESERHHAHHPCCELDVGISPGYRPYTRQSTSSYLLLKICRPTEFLDKSITISDKVSDVY